MDDDFDSLVARMVDSCKEIETITLYDTNGINFAHFFGLSSEHDEQLPKVFADDSSRVARY